MYHATKLNSVSMLYVCMLSVIYLSLYLRDLLGFKAGGREESSGHGAGDTAVVGGGRGGLVVCRVHLRVVECLPREGEREGGRGGERRERREGEDVGRKRREGEEGRRDGEEGRRDGEEGGDRAR